MDELRKIIDEHDDSIHCLFKKMAVMEVCYRNISETLTGINNELVAIRNKIDHILEINGRQDANIAEYRALFKGQGKNVAWLMSIVSSVTTGLVVGAILRFLR